MLSDKGYRTAYVQPSAFKHGIGVAKKGGKKRAWNRKTIGSYQTILKPRTKFYDVLQITERV